jgi:imidazole glycerol-phosphate synthase subunit HisH
LITILDSGICNVHSVEKALTKLGSECRIDFSIGSSDKVVLPGVGAFGAAMATYAPIEADIVSYVRGGGKLLGICLGQQLLFERSSEMGEHRGLGLIPGSVKYLPVDAGLKVPHMGWSPLQIRRKEGLAKYLSEGERAYFVHSLFCDCEDPFDVSAVADYGTVFPAMVEHGNVWGTQFHPEKSGDVGMRILRSFVEW